MSDITEQLGRLDQLRAAGIISDEEFRRLKTKLIDDDLANLPTYEPVAAEASGKAKRRLNLRIALFLWAAILVFLFSIPLLAEGVVGECSAVEIRSVRDAAREDPDNSDAKEIGAGLLALIQRASDGAIASAQSKRNYPSLPPALGCLMAYYKLSLGSKLNAAMYAFTDRQTDLSATQPKGLFTAETIVGPSSGGDIISHPDKPTYRYGVEQTLETTNGVLTVKEPAPKESDWMTAIYFNKTLLTGEDTANILAAFPSTGKAEIALVETACAGSICPDGTPQIVDTRGHSVFMSEQIPIKTDHISIRKRSDSLFVITGYAVDDPHGPYSVLYDEKRRIAFAPSYDGATDFLDFVGKPANSIFLDKKAVLPVSELLGDRLIELRKNLNSGSPLRLAGMETLVGEGCSSAPCANSDAIFGISIRTGHAWAAWAVKRKPHHAGVLPETDMPPEIMSSAGKILHVWLAKHGWSASDLE